MHTDTPFVYASRLQGDTKWSGSEGTFVRGILFGFEL